LYYEKLKVLFQNSTLTQFLNKDIIERLDDFIRTELNNGYEYLNPYKFAFENKILDDHSLQLFLTYTDDDKLFKIKAFVDCYKCTGKKLNLSNLEVDEYIYCDDCRTEFSIKEFNKHYYLYFKLNDDIELPDKRQIERFDPYSTYDIMNRLHGNLKVESPSSYSSNIKGTDEGDYPTAATVTEIIQNNSDSKGNPISNSAKSLSESLMNMLMTNEAV
jgi:hypothetical protein